MTEWGGKISDLSVEDLQETLAEIDDDGKAVKRLVAAIAYKQGQSSAEIEKTFGISEKNVYMWLDRFEERGLEEELYNEPMPGRPSRLTDEQLDQLHEILTNRPKKLDTTSRLGRRNSSSIGSKHNTASSIRSDTSAG